MSQSQDDAVTNRTEKTLKQKDEIIKYIIAVLILQYVSNWYSGVSKENCINIQYQAN